MQVPKLGGMSRRTWRVKLHSLSNCKWFFCCISLNLNAVLLWDGDETKCIDKPCLINCFNYHYCWLKGKNIPKLGQLLSEDSEIAVANFFLNCNLHMVGYTYPLQQRIKPQNLSDYFKLFSIPPPSVCINCSECSVWPNLFCLSVFQTVDQGSQASFRYGPIHFNVYLKWILDLMVHDCIWGNRIAFFQVFDNSNKRTDQQLVGSIRKGVLYFT